MNWGKSITLVLVLFAGFIIYMVIQFSTKNVDLVSDDYYQQELDYNTMYDAKENAINLNQDIAVRQQGDYVLVEFPVFFRDIPSQATVHFYKPDNADGDVQITTDKSGIAVEKNRLKNGNYNVKVMIRAKDKDYYFQEEIAIEHK